MKQPFQQFAEWFQLAKNTKAIADATAMTLATVGEGNQPSARMVLLKGFDERGFVFYTNLESRKSSEIKQNPKAALCFYWAPLDKQIRIEGTLELVSDEEADEYFATRPRQSQIGAWASKQSRPLESKAILIKDVALLNAKYVGRDVPRPPHWSGWRLKPNKIEFWQQVEYRLHDREVFELTGTGWEPQKLYP